ncbi:transglycosylase SLT domain-containing protein [Planomonospora corallina]|uniref:Transglycosylase SLT domain-containing protein n=1 Tax=Planomonospora corallina TaxID=1806052 RepID=A0ABV8ICZ2_9ACTN
MDARTGRGTPVVASIVGLAVALSGCTGSPGAASATAPGRTAQSAQVTAPVPAPERQATSAATGAEPGTTAAATETAHRTPVPSEALPDPDAAIPRDPARLARSLTETSERLRRAVDEWRSEGDPSRGQAPEPVVLLALYQQRAYRLLARDPRLASRTYARLPRALEPSVKADVTAIRKLLTLVHPVSRPARFRVKEPKPADVLLGHFRHAERRFGVEWEVLAAVMLVETKFGRVRSPSHTGAQGPMQFMPRTWEAYGMGGDVHDTRDAVLGAANYLHASGAPRHYRRALYAYNHSWAYVDAVLLHARQMKRDIRKYYAYYNWQVFVVTTRGERRLTGP